ncbi:MAG TPA: helix-turn-helix transcriptional regulator [Trebonia sp.]|jgi:transcriptional regulator with XRE-family HTH domain
MSVERPDPEAQAGRMLRRLREARGWTQEEVARRMHAYGYDFHQTMIAKIEAAQRPLRVRELADFASLYCVQIQDLIYPPSGSQGAAAEELAELESLWEKAEERVKASMQRLRAAREAVEAAQADYELHRREQAMLEDRLEFIRQEAGYSWTAVKPDPSAVRTVDDFFGALRQLRFWGGNPSYRTMSDRIGGVFTPQAMQAVVSGDVRPDLELLAAVVTACGGSEEDEKGFATALRRISLAN